MDGSLDSALGLGWEVWLSLSVLACLTLFFKFSRFLSVRNLDLLLLFVLVPGMLMILGRPGNVPWSAYIWLFVGSGLWLFRCMLDLGLTRRPLLEPNLNASGLLCLSVGLLGLLLAETVSLPVEEGAARNPAEPSGREDRPTVAPGGNNPAVQTLMKNLPLPSSLEARAAAGDRAAGPGRPGACCAGARPAGDRLAALRPAHHGNGDGRVLPGTPLHADGAGG